MRRLNKKPTATGFLARYAVLIFILIIIGSTAMMLYTTDKAVLDSARRTLGIDAGWAGRHVSKISDGSYMIDPDQNLLTENCLIVLVSDSGELLSGRYTETMKVLKDIPPSSGHENFRKLSTEQGIFYVYDYHVRTIRVEGALNSAIQHKRPSRDLYARSVVDSSDFHTVYHDVRKLFFAFLAVLVIMMSIGGIWIFRRASRPVREMCDQLQQISICPDFSERLEDPGSFYETELLTNAYNRLIERAEQIVKQHDEFNENVSHELRTPVALIRSECELIDDLYSNHIRAEVKEATSVIRKQNDRMNSIISDLLYLSRIKRDSYELHMEAVDLADLAESACDDARELHGETRFFACNAAPAEALIDVSLMMIAVQNLVSNALKFSPEGSTIKFSTGREGDMAFLSVSDEGKGISEEDQLRIFEPYYQVQSGRNSEGFGLGLALVQKIAEKHSGTIELSSVPGMGSTFTIYLPAISDSEKF